MDVMTQTGKRSRRSTKIKNMSPLSNDTSVTTVPDSDQHPATVVSKFKPQPLSTLLTRHALISDHSPIAEIRAQFIVARSSSQSSVSTRSTQSPLKLICPSLSSSTPVCRSLNSTAAGTAKKPSNFRFQNSHPRRHPPYRPQSHPNQSSTASVSSSALSQSIYTEFSNPAFRPFYQMSSEEIQPYQSHRFPSPSALEANLKQKDDLKDGTLKKTEPIIDHVGYDQSNFPGRPAGLHPLSFPPLTTRQKFYIIVLQTIGAAILDGAMNFGIGCAMYLNATSVRMWILSENTVAGDMAITIFIQGILTFCIASGMVHVDLRKNKVQAFPYPWPDTSWGTAAKKDPEATRSFVVKWWRKFNNDQGFSRGLHFFSGSDVNDIFNTKLTWRQFLKRLSWSIWKGSVLSVIYFFILWPISIAIVAPIWEHDNLAGTFIAPIIKGIYGAVYGLIQTPICAMIAMGSEDSVRHHRAERQQKLFDNPEKSAMTTTAAERASLIVENRSTPMEERVSAGLLMGVDGSSPKNGITRTRSTRRVDSLRRSLDGIAMASPPSPPSPTEHSAVGLGWRSTDVHRRRSLEAPRTRSRYDSQIMSRSATITSTTRSRHNSAELIHSSPETDSGDFDEQVAHPRRIHVPMRRLTEASILETELPLTD